MARYGKIGRLPREIRESVAEWIVDGVPYGEIAERLNGREDVRLVLAARFGGAAVSDKDVQGWEANSYGACQRARVRVVKNETKENVEGGEKSSVHGPESAVQGPGSTVHGPESTVHASEDGAAGGVAAIADSHGPMGDCGGGTEVEGGVATGVGIESTRRRPEAGTMAGQAVHGPESTVERREAGAAGGVAAIADSQVPMGDCGGSEVERSGIGVGDVGDAVPTGRDPIPRVPTGLQRGARSMFELAAVEPWPEVVEGKGLLEELGRTLRRFVVMPKWAEETLALWTLHTYAFQLRDLSTYMGIESPLPQCGKTTLVTVLSELVNRPLVAANVSSPAFYRSIEELQPTLLIDEGDTFLEGKAGLRGILNAGYTRKTAFVVRVTTQGGNPKAPPSLRYGAASEGGNPKGAGAGGHSTHQTRHRGMGLARFSCWCPKLMATIGHLPATLADRCILVRMHRKLPEEERERLKELDATALRRQCARFVLDHGQEIAKARPELPKSLSDRAADIWEPLLALAELAGGEWPEKARQAAVGLSAKADENSVIGALLGDIQAIFAWRKVDRLFSRRLVEYLTAKADRPWVEVNKGKAITEMWLARQLRPYGVQPRTVWEGTNSGKGYYVADLRDVFRRYAPAAAAEG